MRETAFFESICLIGVACRGSSLRRKAIKSEIVQDGDDRFILTTFSDGEETRLPVVKQPRKKRYPPRPYWHWDLNKSRKKGF
jgi:hypothetical protein